jgi:hypothetical protein
VEEIYNGGGGVCSGVGGGLRRVGASFECKACREGPRVASLAGQSVDLGSVIGLEEVGGICYLVDVLDAEGSAGLAAAAGVGCAWGRFVELSPFLASEGGGYR